MSKVTYRIKSVLTRGWANAINNDRYVKRGADWLKSVELRYETAFRNDNNEQRETSDLDNVWYLLHWYEEIKTKILQLFGIFFFRL